MRGAWSSPPSRARSRSRTRPVAFFTWRRSKVPEVIMPKMGDAMEEGTLVKWLKSEGDEVSEGEAIAVIQGEGEEVPERGDGRAQKPEGAEEEAGDGEEEDGGGEAQAATATEAPEEEDAEQDGRADGRFRASPIVRRLARENDLDLSKIEGTGPAGRI